MEWQIVLDQFLNYIGAVKLSDGNSVVRKLTIWNIYHWNIWKTHGCGLFVVSFRYLEFSKKS